MRLLTARSRLFIIVFATAAIFPFLLARPQSEARAPGAPESRGPLVPKITSVDQLIPFAKIIIERAFIGQRHGWSVKGGERILYESTTQQHPMVRDAFIRVLKDKGALVDVVIRDSGPLELCHPVVHIGLQIRGY